MAHITLRHIAHWCAFGALLFMTGRSVSAAQMTFDDRMACQTAIETVRWSKTLWPETNPEPKPLLSEVLSQDAIRTKVIDSARMQAALAGLYGIRIDDAMLQAELERMSAATRAPDQLRELYSALDNNPVRVAECLARPTLVRQQLETHYANDRNQHAPVRAWAEAGLRRAAAQDSTGGEDIAFVRQTEEKTAGGDTVGLGDDLDGIRLSPSAWDARLAQLDSARSRPQSAPELRESAIEFVHESLREVNGARMTVRVQRWPKVDFATWWGAEAARWGAFPARTTGTKRMLTLPPVTGRAAKTDWSKGGGADDTWRLDPYVPTARFMHSAIWTGSEMIIWGGRADGESFQSGGRYSPATDTWISTSLVGAPSKRSEHTAVWTGNRMIVWGGDGGSVGGIYDASSDTWKTMSSVGAPSSRTGFVAVWAGNKMLVWGGFSGVVFGDGARYDPISDKWSSMTPANAPSPRREHVGVWTGTRLLIWGGFGPGNQELSDGRSYEPETNTWLSISTTGAPAGRAGHVAVWTGKQMIVWGGRDEGLDALNTGGLYDPAAGTWTETPLAGAPSPRVYGHSAVWDGDEIIVWGGSSGFEAFNTGARYKPGATAWVAIDPANAPTARYFHTAVWTGDEMIVWGGCISGGNAFASGARYRPTTDVWTAMADVGASPAERTDHTAIWTGTEMLVWGGTDG